MRIDSFKIIHRAKTFRIHYNPTFCRLSVLDYSNCASEFLFEKEEEFYFANFFHLFRSRIPHYEKIELFGKIKNALFSKEIEVKVGQIYEDTDGSRAIVARLDTEQFCLLQISGNKEDVGIRVAALVKKIEDVFGIAYFRKDKVKLISTP